MTNCSGQYVPKDYNTCYPFPEDRGGTCYPPCFIRFTSVTTEGEDKLLEKGLLSLKRRVRRIDIEKEQVSEQEPIGSQPGANWEPTRSPDLEPTGVLVLIQCQGVAYKLVVFFWRLKM